MKKIFYTSAFLWLLFEIANVYFIMPIPGISQEVNSLDWAYFLHSWRWIFRSTFAIFMLFSFKNAFNSSKWLPFLPILAIAGIMYETHFEMAADTMFYQPSVLLMKKNEENKIDRERLIIGVTNGDEAKAYPIQFLGYHHQVRDSIGGKPIMVTYCTVCRTGRVYEPVVNGKTENFRLVGMDHFNAMFEDATTKSWWRQVTGEAVAGKCKGQSLPEFPSQQVTLEKWLSAYPNSYVMQPDPKFRIEYDSLANYEDGKRKGKLTRRDTLSWQKKSWVVGVKVNKTKRVFDWNDLQQQHIIHDIVDNQPIIVFLSKDNKSFNAFARSRNDEFFILQNDTLISDNNRYDFFGKTLNSTLPNLKKVNVYQEYWHSWQLF